MPVKRLTAAEHQEAADDLFEMRAKLMRLANSLPYAKASKAKRKAAAAIKAIDSLRCAMDGQYATDVGTSFDPRVYYPGPQPRLISVRLSELPMTEPDGEHRPIKHNTMRFDVHMAHIHPMLIEHEMAGADELAKEIRDAIIQVVNTETTAPDHCCLGAYVHERQDPPTYQSNEWLHCETISWDFS